MNPFFFLYAWLTCANFVMIGYAIYIMTTLETLKSQKNFSYTYTLFWSVKTVKFHFESSIYEMNQY